MSLPCLTPSVAPVTFRINQASQPVIQGSAKPGSYPSSALSCPTVPFPDSPVGLSFTSFPESTIFPLSSRSLHAAALPGTPSLNSTQNSTSWILSLRHTSTLTYSVPLAPRLSQDPSRLLCLSSCLYVPKPTHLDLSSLHTKYSLRALAMNISSLYL